MSEQSPSVAIVMPAYNAAHLLPQTLKAAIEAAGGGRVVVVDPGSNDGTADVAEAMGAHVIRLGHRAGPALARNRGVDQVDEDVVLFIDSDCVAHADVVERVQHAFQGDPELVSITGSYDDSPPEPNFFSQYMNLRHHFFHQKADQEHASFWAGCGAVRRDAYEAVGGFDAEQFPMPMIEDIELGQRLQNKGKTKLDPRLHVKHLKRWTLKSVVEADIKFRAIPWSKLIARTGQQRSDLNLHWSQKVSAALSPFVLVTVPALPILLVTLPASAPAAAPTIASMYLQRDFIKFFGRTKGWRFALGAYLFHQVHLFYSAATFASVQMAHRAGLLKE